MIRWLKTHSINWLGIAVTLILFTVFLVLAFALHSTLVAVSKVSEQNAHGESQFFGDKSKNSAAIDLYGKKNTGMMNTYVDQVVLQKLYRVNWKKNKYSKKLLKAHGKSAGNNYGLNYWIDSTAGDSNNSDHGNRVVTQLPNSGDILFSRDKFGTDFLRSTLWKKPLAKDPNNFADKETFYTVTNKLAKQVNHRSFLNIGIDFGLPISIVATDDDNATQDKPSIKSNLWFGGSTKYVDNEESHSHKTINDTYDTYTSTTKKSSTFDSHNIFSSLLNSNGSHPDHLFATNMPKITSVITANTVKKSSDPTQNLFNTTGSAWSITPPLLAHEMKLFNIDPNLSNQSSQFSIGAFGLVVSNFADGGTTPLYLTFTYQNDLNNSINNVNGKGIDAQDAHSEHLIIDVNADAKSQINEISDIYANLDNSIQYSNAHKLAFLNALDGRINLAKNTKNFNWGVHGRESFSMVENNAFGEPTVINKEMGNIITSDRYNKNDPSRNISTGFHPDKFSNFVLQQVWPRQQNNIDFSRPSQQNMFYCTKNRYKFFDGYKRDRTVKTTNPQIYTAPNYSTYDSMSLYETSFYFDVKYISGNHYWKIGDYLSSSQYYYFTQVNPRPVITSQFKTTIPMIAHFGSGINKTKIALVWNSNLHFATGGIVAITIVLVLIVGAFIFFRPWKKISILSTKNIDDYMRSAEAATKSTPRHDMKNAEKKAAPGPFLESVEKESANNNKNQEKDKLGAKENTDNATLFEMKKIAETDNDKNSIIANSQLNLDSFASETDAVIVTDVIKPSDNINDSDVVNSNKEDENNIQNVSEEETSKIKNQNNNNDDDSSDTGWTVVHK